METTQQKVDRLQAELDALLGQSPRNESAVNKTAIALDEAKRELEQEQAAMVRIQGQEEKRDQYTLPVDLDTLYSSPIHLDASGNPYEAKGANHIALQIVKDALRMNDEDWNEKYTALEAKYDNDIRIITAQRDEQERLAKEKDGLIEELRQQLSQAIIEKKEAEAKRDAAMHERKEIEVKESQDLATMIAEQEAEKARKAAEDRAKRTVYDVVPDNEIFPRNYTAKLAATGETITYNWTQQQAYIVLTDPDEILQFRNQHANTEPNQQDNATVEESVQDSVSQFPEVPRAEAPELPAVSTPVVGGAPEVAGEGKTLEEAFRRIEELERSVYGNSADKEVA